MLNLGVIGFGAVAENAHSLAIKNLDKYFKVVSVFDIDRERMLKARDIFKARDFSSIDELLNDGSIDAVVITTPPKTHKDIILKALKRGINVLCEKPLCINLKEFQEIEGAIRESGKVVYTLHNWLYSPHIIKIKEFVSGIGKINYIRWETLRKSPSKTASYNWRMDVKMAGGGIIFDHGWHVLYIIKSLVGKNHSRVSVDFVMENGIDVISDLRIVYDDVISNIHLSWKSCVRRNHLLAYGEDGIVIFDDDNVVFIDKNSNTQRYNFNEKISASSSHPLWTEKVYLDFYNALNGDRKIFEENLNQVKECIEVISKAYEYNKKREIKRVYS